MSDTFSNRAINVRTLSAFSDISRRSAMATLGECGSSDQLGRPSMTILPGGIKVKGWHRTGQAGPETHKRGPITEFSSKSRARLRERLMALDWPRYAAFFLTLTYHNTWDDDYTVWKAQRKAFHMRVKRRWTGFVGECWKQEFQQRGAPHFHSLLLFDKGTMPEPHEFIRWCKAAWSEIVGASSDEDHRRYGADVVRCRWSGPRPDGRGCYTIGSLIGYIVKEMGKLSQNPPGEHGRLWAFQGALFFSDGEVIELTGQEWAALCWAVSQHGERVHSWYLSNIHPAWAGFRILGGPEILEKLGIRGRGAPVQLSLCQA